MASKYHAGQRLTLSRGHVLEILTATPSMNGNTTKHHCRWLYRDGTTSSGHWYDTHQITGFVKRAASQVTA